MLLAGTIISVALQAYMGLLFVRMILSWIPAFAPEWEPHGVLLVIFEAIYTLTDPPIRLFDRLLPPVRTGGVSFSLGYIAVFLVLLLLQRLNDVLLLS